MFKSSHLLATLLLPFSYMTNAYDFNGDGTDDILWRHTSTGQNYLYLMDGGDVGSGHPVNRVGGNWVIEALGDFNGDGNDDIYWRESGSGRVHLYTMNSHQIAASYSLGTVDEAWRLVSTGDYDGNGTTDILWRHAFNGINYIHYFSQGRPTQISRLNQIPDANWFVAGSGDFNGDGTDDILWRNLHTYQNYLYLMQTDGSYQPKYLNSVSSPSWYLALVGDVTNDGTADILWRNTTTGENVVYALKDGNIQTTAHLSSATDPAWTMADIDDFDGDGDNDILWRHLGTGSNAIHRLENQQVSVSNLNAVNISDWQMAGAVQTIEAMISRMVPKNAFNILMQNAVRSATYEVDQTDSSKRLECHLSDRSSYRLEAITTSYLVNQELSAPREDCLEGTETGTELNKVLSPLESITISTSTSSSRNICNYFKLDALGRQVLSVITDDVDATIENRCLSATFGQTKDYSYYTFDYSIPKEVTQYNHVTAGADGVWGSEDDDTYIEAVSELNDFGIPVLTRVYFKPVDDEALGKLQMQTETHYINGFVPTLTTIDIAMDVAGQTQLIRGIEVDYEASANSLEKASWYRMVAGFRQLVTVDLFSPKL